MEKQSIYYKPKLQEYVLISGGTRRVFALTDDQFQKLLKPGAVHVVNRVVWRLAPEEKETYNMLTVKTGSHNSLVNRK